MKSVTLSVKSAAGPIFKVGLRAGAPWEGGKSIVAPKVPFDLWDGSGLTEGKVRDGILEETPSAAVLNLAAEVLGKRLFPDAVAKAWSDLGPDFRTYVDIDSKLNWVPWEIALAPSKQRAFLNSASPIVRYRKPKTTLKRPPSDRVVMLVVVSVDSKNDGIGAEKELLFLREALRPADRFIEMQVLRNPKLLAIYQALERKPAILHFIGHGKEGELKLWADGQKESWSIKTIGEDLDNAHWSPNLVFLNACRSVDGKTDAKDMSRTWSVAEVFLEKGSSAVIAMQGPVSGDASGLIAHELYRRIVAGDTVDVALAAARHKLSKQADYSQTSAPYLPALIVAGPPEELLQRTCCIDSDPWIDGRQYRTLVSNCYVVAPALKEFVDREPVRWNVLDQFAERVDRQPLSLIVGPSGMGKTWLLAWCMDGWLRRRQQVRYIRMSGCLNWLEFVRRVRDGSDEKGVLSEKLSQSMRDEINVCLNSLLKSGRAAAKADKQSPVQEATLNLELLKKRNPEGYAQALAGLADIFDRNSDKATFILVLDDFGDGKEFFPSEDFGYLIKHFVEVVRSRCTKLHVVISLSDTQRARYTEPLPVAPIEIPHFKDDLADYFRLLYKLRFDNDFPKKFEGLLANIGKKTFTGEGLRKALETIRDYAELDA